MSSTALDRSRDRVLATAPAGEVVLAHATAIRAVGAWTLAPAHREPARHVEAAHAEARQHLARLTAHDPAREVVAVMTDELFTRLTDARPAPLTAPAGVGRYTYTPRKSLRRVLDHALDHLNQIDQWTTWQRHGVVIQEEYPFRARVRQGSIPGEAQAVAQFAVHPDTRMKSLEFLNDAGCRIGRVVVHDQQFYEIRQFKR